MGRLHRQWFDASAMADLLGADFGLAEKNTLYRCLDKLVVHKDDLFKFLVQRWGELFGAKFDVLLYDLTSTYFETDIERSSADLRQFGYSRDKRGDCRQVVIALIVTPEGFPLSYEVLSGNTSARRCAGEAPASGWRSLRAGTKHSTHRQGARDAAPTSDPRSTTDETRCGQTRCRSRRDDEKDVTCYVRILRDTTSLCAGAAAV